MAWTDGRVGGGAVAPGTLTRLNLVVNLSGLSRRVRYRARDTRTASARLFRATNASLPLALGAGGMHRVSATESPPFIFSSQKPSNFQSLPMTSLGSLETTGG